MSAQKIKVILVDDSAFMRILISEILRSDPDVEIIATAKDGKEGVAKAVELKPDVVVTDILMPGYDGIYLVKELMQRGATPIILLSSLDRTDGHIFEALQAGAFDFIDKPGEQQRKREADYNLLNLVKEAAKKKEVPVTRSGKLPIATRIHFHLNYITTWWSSVRRPAAPGRLNLFSITFRKTLQSL